MGPVSDPALAATTRRHSTYLGMRKEKVEAPDGECKRRQSCCSHPLCLVGKSERRTRKCKLLMHSFYTCSKVAHPSIYEMLQKNPSWHCLHNKAACAFPSQMLATMSRSVFLTRSKLDPSRHMNCTALNCPNAAISEFKVVSVVIFHPVEQSKAVIWKEEQQQKKSFSCESLSYKNSSIWSIRQILSLLSLFFLISLTTQHVLYSQDNRPSNTA